MLRSLKLPRKLPLIARKKRRPPDPNDRDTMWGYFFIACLVVSIIATTMVVIAWVLDDTDSLFFDIGSYSQTGAGITCGLIGAYVFYNAYKYGPFTTVTISKRHVKVIMNLSITLLFLQMTFMLAAGVKLVIRF